MTFAAVGNIEVQGDLQLDFAPLVALVAANVVKDLGVSLPTPDNVVVALEQPQLARLVPVATMLGGWAAAMAVVVVLFGVGCVGGASPFAGHPARRRWAGSGGAPVAVRASGRVDGKSVGFPVEELFVRM